MADRSYLRNVEKVWRALHPNVDFAPGSNSNPLRPLNADRVTTVESDFERSERACIPITANFLNRHGVKLVERLAVGKAPLFHSLCLRCKLHPGATLAK